MARLGLRKVVKDNFKPVEDADIENEGKAWAHILGLIDPSISHQFSGVSSALGVLAKAKLLFGSKDPLRYQICLQKLQDLKFKGGDIEHHITTVEALIKAAKCYTSDQISISQELRFLANSLGQEHEAIKIRINADELTTWDAAVKYLRATQFVAGTKEPTAVASTGNLAFAITKSTNRRETLNYKQMKELARELIEKGIPVCTTCFRIGHYVEGHKPRKPTTTPESKLPDEKTGSGMNVAASVLSPNQSTSPTPVDLLNSALDSSLYI